MIIDFVESIFDLFNFAKLITRMSIFSVKFSRHSLKKNNGIRRSEPERAEDNEILGSGNFVVVKGGTFYGTDRSFKHR